ncbi:hypothetical protein [Mucilaginibacter sp.]|uniref:hypothetical protein n=1 Tax=Mucilaginibacter sp. TaxID=1882438 RepID=UPI0035BBA198
MKKFIIAAALVLTSGVTAFSLTRDNGQATEKVQSEQAALAVKDSSRPKADIATAD